MRAYGKNCLTTHAPFGALNLSIAAFLWSLHPFDVPRSAKHNTPLQNQLRGELEAVQIAEHSHSLYVIALCTFMPDFTVSAHYEKFQTLYFLIFARSLFHGMICQYAKLKKV